MLQPIVCRGPGRGDVIRQLASVLLFAALAVSSASAQTVEEQLRDMRLEMQQLRDELARVKGENVSATFGNAIRSYVLDDRMVKDVRTKTETAQVEAVLNGEIDEFIEAFLRKRAKEQATA